MPDRFRDGAAVHIEDLYQGFRTGTSIKMVLDNIDCSVLPGEFVTVVGPSGCGKTTLLRIILGQDRPINGQLLIDGQAVGAPDPRRGVVYQHYSLFPHLTALDNIMIGHRLQHSPLWRWSADYRRRRDEAMSFLERTGIAEHANKYPHQLSGGQKQRVAIAQTLFQQPRIVLMDEPFSALDPGTRESMQMWLLELWEIMKFTIFFVTHDLEEAAFLGSRLIALSQYYTDDRGDGPDVNRGAKIVVDKALGRTVNSPAIKATGDFGQLIENVRRQAFDPDYRQHVTMFDLSHPHSWITSTDEERNNK